MQLILEYLMVPGIMPEIQPSVFQELELQELGQLSHGQDTYFTCGRPRFFLSWVLRAPPGVSPEYKQSTLHPL